MSSDLNEQTITGAVQRTFDASTDQRFREVLVCLVQHLHDFAREVHLTGEEWFAAMDFLERVGKISSPTRQEVMLLSDILGFSMLLDRINQHSGSSVTASALLGPFYVEGRPTANNGDDISDGVIGTPMFVTGRVVDENGNPIAGAYVDTWHSDGEGFLQIRNGPRVPSHRLVVVQTTPLRIHRDLGAIPASVKARGDKAARVANECVSHFGEKCDEP